MTIGVLTLAQLKTLFQTVTVAITGLPGTDVRHSYPADGQPGFAVGEDVAFLFVAPVDDAQDKQRDIIYATSDAVSAEKAVFYTRVLRVSWTLYGPNSFNLADGLRHGLLLETIRETLAASGIYPITAISPATRTPENRNGQWYDRSDLQVLFNVATLRDGSVPSISEIIIEQKSGNGENQGFTISI